MGVTLLTPIEDEDSRFPKLFTVFYNISVGIHAF